MALRYYPTDSPNHFEIRCEFCGRYDSIQVFRENQDKPKPCDKVDMYEDVRETLQLGSPHVCEWEQNKLGVRVRHWRSNTRLRISGLPHRIMNTLAGRGASIEMFHDLTPSVEVRALEEYERLKNASPSKLMMWHFFGNWRADKVHWCNLLQSDLGNGLTLTRKVAERVDIAMLVYQADGLQSHARERARVFASRGMYSTAILTFVASVTPFVAIDSNAVAAGVACAIGIPCAMLSLWFAHVRSTNDA